MATATTTSATRTSSSSSSATAATAATATTAVTATAAVRQPYGYGNYSQSQQTALNAGYNEGIKEGRKNRNRGGYRNMNDFSAYRNADKDYNSRYGDRYKYQQYFRRGFENGFNDGAQRLLSRTQGFEQGGKSKPGRFAARAYFLVSEAPLDTPRTPPLISHLPARGCGGIGRRASLRS